VNISYNFAENNSKSKK